MFKRGDIKEIISNEQRLKTSVCRAIRQNICENYPLFAQTDLLETIMPKKDPLLLTKCHDGVEIVSRLDKEYLFFRKSKGPWVPNLRLVHQYPDILKYQTVDTGAIKFVLSGANIMCPGLTSKGGKLNDECDVETVVGIRAEGKEHPLCVGIMKMDCATIAKENKGIAIENMHHLSDSLWTYQPIVE